MQPVEIIHHLDHPFEKRTTRGCRICGKARTHINHHGTPISLNALGSGNQFAYRAAKVAWEARLLELLTTAELVRPLDRVYVEAEMCFPDRRRRDQGNYRFIIEKALGDTLTAGGWLADDDWGRYEFGNLTARYAKGESWTRLVVFPMPAQELAA